MTSSAMRLPILLVLLGLAAPPPAGAQAAVDLPRVVLGGVPATVIVRGVPAGLDSLDLHTGDTTHAAAVAGDSAVFAGVRLTDAAPVTALHGGQILARAEASALPGWVSVLPSLVAILVALVFRQVVPAIFAGVWLGGWLVHGLSLAGAWRGLLDTVPAYVVGAMSDGDRASIIVFSLMIGGMVGIISRNGGTMGIVAWLVPWARTPRRGQLATAMLGLAIFFDDYANSLIVGNTMRPITDRLRISREKLAYLVDSTAAPVSTLALVTTWIGFQVGLIGEAVAGIPNYDESAYSIFLNSIAYNFYPVLTIFFVLAVAWTSRDFGPMRRAELRARTTGQVVRPGAKLGHSAAEAAELTAHPEKPQRAINAVLPVLVLVAVVLGGIYVTGLNNPDRTGDSLRAVIGSGNSYLAMMWGSLLSVLVAAGLSIGQRILTLTEVVDGWYAGLKSMLLAMIILVLAWALAGVNTELHTADYLVSVLSGSLLPALLPAMIFVLAAATAFATGSSWGVMGIVMPLAIPLTWGVLEAHGYTGAAELHLLYSAVAAVLAGAVWGDHCSPISDTTILSSMASQCDHIDHVRTQLPYALLVGAVAIGLGTIPVGFGLPWWAGLGLGAVVLMLVLQFLGRPIETAPAAALDTA